MRKLTALIVPMLLIVALVGCSDQATDPTSTSTPAEYAQGGGFDMYGYNYTAKLFNGTADGADKNLDGTYNGSALYGNDHLNMKWSNEWRRGRFEDNNWDNPPYVGAWTTNHWNGNVPGGSGELWHYKIIWVGTELEESEYWVDGGYAIWNQFEVIFSHGTYANEHFWDTHATPSGLGIGM